MIFFDGADDINSISQLFSFENQGNIFYTSRNSVLKGFLKSQIYEIDAINKNEIVVLLLKVARLKDSFEEYMNSTRSIIEEFEFLTLVIDQTKAFIVNEKCGIYDYLIIFRNHRQKLMQKNAYKKTSSYHKSIYATWDLSYNVLIESVDMNAF